MHTVYHAAHAINARIVCDLLNQEGIAAMVQGDYLQGAMGELPAAGLVRVVVPEADAARARELVAAWEAAPPDDLPEPAPAPEARPAPAAPPARGGRLIVGLALGLVLGVGGTLGWFRLPVASEGIDHDGDGRIDERWVHAAGGPLRLESDRDLDGRVDLVTRYDLRGMPEYTRSDDDFDGRDETEVFYRQGQPTLQSSDTDGDGFHDLRTRFVFGVADRVEFLVPPGRVLRVEHLRLGKVVRVQRDTDGDGTPDRETRYDALGEPLPDDAAGR